MKIAIVIPSNDMVHADFAMCLARLVSYEAQHGENQVAIINPKSSLVQKGRTDGVLYALEMGADYVLFIDSDQTFPEYGLSQLLSHNLDLVGATCKQRREPHKYTARGFNSQKMWDELPNRSLVRVYSNGFAFCLAKVRLFDETPMNEWFEVNMNWSGHWTSEDEHFSNLVRKILNVDTHVDVDLSRKIGHLGVKEFI